MKNNNSLKGEKKLKTETRCQMKVKTKVELIKCKSNTSTMLRNKLICYQYLFIMGMVLIQTNYLAKST